ncbi:MAG: cellulase family glycosylhydrolase [Bacteroidota bacterium]
MKLPVLPHRWIILILLPTFLFSWNVYSQKPVSKREGVRTIPSSAIESGTVPVPEYTGKNITTYRDCFTDPTGRSMFLRGINLGGSSKVPWDPRMASHVRQGFFNGRDVSFKGRPFPLDEADGHFQRLKEWGFHFVRFLVTWEAIEHEGPGIYDTDYLAYVRELIKKAGDYGINVVIDPHEDVWSRFTGGDGAPLWTLELVGIDPQKVQETGAAIVHNLYGDPFPRMIWYTNNYKLAAATMFTLFFAGNDFAPATLIDNIPVQDFLQGHYLAAMTRLAEELRGLPNVIGFELMNEPSAGYVGLEDLTRPWDTEIVGDAPSPWQSILAGEGIPQRVKRYRVGAVSLVGDGERVLNPDGVSLWKDGDGIWIRDGVGERSADGTVILKDTAYFSHVNGKKVNFNMMYYRPFALKYAAAIRAVDPDWIIMVDNVLSPYPGELPEMKYYSEVKWVNGSHWYDDVTLVKKQYIPFIGLYGRELVLGKGKVEKAFEKTLAGMIYETHKNFGNAPTLLGEFGIPFDLDGGKSYRSGNFNTQVRALDRSFRVAEKNLLSYTLWNYTADNTNEYGDSWNGEDLSVFSLSQQTRPEDINSGGRALEAVIRPYPKKINGKLLGYEYDCRKKELKIRWESEKKSDYPTEIFLPDYVYGDGFSVTTNVPELRFDQAERMLLCYPESKGEYTLVVSLP